MAPTSEPAGKKAHSCISIATLQIMGREKAVRNGATQHIRIHVRVILDMEDVCEKMTKDSAQGVRQAEFQCSRTQSVVINSL